MRGIDIYHGDGYPMKSEAAKAYRESDFVIIKATQGTSYRYTDYYKKMIEKTLKDGKLAGAYHYAAGKVPEEEAEYFLKTVKNHIGHIILCLDWESLQNKAWGSPVWCKRFFDYVKEQTGIVCLLYTGLDGIQQNKNLAGNVPLWFAGYPNPNYNGWKVPPFKYSISPWSSYTIWQYTSSGEKIDRNTTDMTFANWMNLALGSFFPGTKQRGKAQNYLDETSCILPPRGWYQYGDGMLVYLAYRPKIKKVQELINLKNNSKLVLDGMYGSITRKAVKELQKEQHIQPDGLFGPVTLSKCINR